jgi:hypothetical protein
MVKSSKELRHTIDLLHPCKVIDQKESEPTRKKSTPSQNVSIEPQTLENISDISSSEAEEDSDDSETKKISQDRYENRSSFFHANNSVQVTNRNLISKTMSEGMETNTLFQAANEVSFVPHTIVAPIYEPVPNPLKESLSGDMPHVIPASPLTEPCALEIIIMEEFMNLNQPDVKSVPLVEPGRKITQDAFAKAIDGIDFSRVFDSE